MHRVAAVMLALELPCPSVLLLFENFWLEEALWRETAFPSEISPVRQDWFFRWFRALYDPLQQYKFVAESLEKEFLKVTDYKMVVVSLDCRDIPSC